MRAGATRRRERRLRRLRAFPEADEVALDIVHDDLAEFALRSRGLGEWRGAFVRRACARPNDFEPVERHQTIATRPAALSDGWLLTGCTRARAKNGESVRDHFAQSRLVLGSAVPGRRCADGRVS